MLPRSSVCCRAVKRQLPPSCDSIWVSDDTLRHAFHRFVNTRIRKRHGSFVPGPMESRRRLGRRRMAHLTESVPMSPPNLGPLWGFFAKGGSAQWQWEAPSAPKTNDQPASVLPSWLLEWDTPPDVAPDSEDTEVSTRALTGQAISIKEDVLNFQRTLQATSPDEMPRICLVFNQRFKQSLRVGLVSETEMRRAIQTVSHAIRIEFSKSGLGDTQALLHFYQAFWDGLVTCKVLQPVDLSAKTLNMFLLHLGDLPIFSEVQALAHSVLHTASVAQLRKMNKSLSPLVLAWARSWLHEHPSGDAQSSLLEANQNLRDSSRNLDYLEGLITEIGSKNEHGHTLLQEGYERVKECLHCALESILKVETIMMPGKKSIDTLACVFEYLPREQVHHLLDTNTDHVIRIHNSMDGSSENLHHGWLTLVAKTRGISDKLFVDIMKRMQECKGIPELPLPGDVILSRWISQGHLIQGDLVRITSEVFASTSDPPDAGLVLFAIDHHREMMFNRTKDLFKLYRDLRRYEDVHKILLRLQNLGLKLPSDIIGPTTGIMSKYDVMLADDINKRFYSGLGARGQYLRADLTPDYIVSMVNDANIHPLRIWKVMGIPFYENMPPLQRAAFSKRQLSPSVMKIVTKTAIAFANANARPQRVALRNVHQCLHHLRRHRAPITPELARAISHAAFTRKILAGQWVSKELKSWILRVIEAAEGTDVAIIADMAVTCWNENLEQKQQEIERKRAREKNVLRVGPID